MKALSAVKSDDADEATSSIADWFTANGRRSVLESGAAIPTSSSPELIHITSGMLLLECMSGSLASNEVFCTLFYSGDVLHSYIWRTLPHALLRAVGKTELRIADFRHVTKAEASATTPKIVDKAYELWSRLLRQSLANGALDAKSRLAELLTMLGDRIGRRTDGGIVIQCPMGRRQMASYLALNPETLSRQMTCLKKMGVISCNGRRLITIKDWDGLARIRSLARTQNTGSSAATVD